MHKLSEEDFRRRAREILRVHFAIVAEQGGAVENRDDGPNDLLLRTDEGLIVAEMKQMASTRLKELEWGLAVGILEGERKKDLMQARPIIMLALPKVGPKAVLFAGQFMNRYAQDMGWCLFDPYGGYTLEVPDFNISEQRLSRPERGQRAVPGREALFSDLNRLMLKILLLRATPPELWGGPRQVIQSAQHLKVVAKVSTEKAYSFLRTFSAAGYLRESAAGIEIVRREELMRTWLHHEQAFCTESVPVRSIYGPIDDLAPALLRHGAPTQFAQTGFEACRQLGVLHTAVPRQEVSLYGDIDLAIVAWKLRKCDARDADFFIVKMVNPKSVMAGLVAPKGVPVVDVLEAALAVSGQLPRGKEQAEYIFNEVLGWDRGR